MSAAVMLNFTLLPVVIGVVIISSCTAKTSGPSRQVLIPYRGRRAFHGLEGEDSGGREAYGVVLNQMLGSSS